MSTTAAKNLDTNVEMSLANNKIIYLIDNDENVWLNVQALLSAMNITLCRYETGADVLKAIKETPPDCMIMELNLPETNGLALYKQVISQGIKPPVIFLASQGDIELAVDAMRMGAADFIEKPHINPFLLKAIKSIIDQD